MNVLIIGTGYVGLISGLCLSLKHNVTCVDINQNLIDKLNSGKPHIYEDGLKEMLEEQISSGKFKCINLKDINLSKVEIVIFCVGTPSLKNGSCDLSFLKSSILSVIPFLENVFHPISLVIKSTVPPGTVSSFIEPLVREFLPISKYPNIGFGMNPEFLREGSAVEDFLYPDRIVFGFNSEITKLHLEKLYDHFDCPKIKVSTSCSEMIKYVNNSLLALQISAVNEYSKICEQFDLVDIKDVMNGVLLDKRWQNNTDSSKPPSIHNYLKPGCGFGGSCFPKDVKALSSVAKNYGLKTPILEATISINEKQPFILLEKLNCKIKLRNAKVLLLGITFKPNTDDIRESPTHGFIKCLNSYGSKIFVHDPIAINKLRNHPSSKFLEDSSYCNDFIGVLEIVDVIILVTPWHDYLKLPKLLKNKNKIIFDTRGVFKASDFLSSSYLKVGLK